MLDLWLLMMMVLKILKDAVRFKGKLTCLRIIRSLYTNCWISIILSIYEELLVIKINHLWIGDVLLNRENCTHSSENIRIINKGCVANLSWMLSQILLILSLSKYNFRLLQSIERLCCNKLKRCRLMLSDLMLVLVLMWLLNVIWMMEYLLMTILIKLVCLLFCFQLKFFDNLGPIKFLKITSSRALRRGIWKSSYL